MKCSTCGNPVPRGTLVCPYCEAPLSREAPARTPAVKTINIKEGSLPGDAAAERMEALLANARAAGTKVVIIIHGYGSQGTGGFIKEAVRKHLSRLRANHRVRSVVFGEDFGPANDDAIRIAGTHKELLAPHVFGSGNQGITVVLL